MPGIFHCSVEEPRLLGLDAGRCGSDDETVREETVVPEATEDMVDESIPGAAPELMPEMGAPVARVPEAVLEPAPEAVPETRVPDERRLELRLEWRLTLGRDGSAGNGRRDGLLRSPGCSLLRSLLRLMLRSLLGSLPSCAPAGRPATSSEVMGEAGRLPVDAPTSWRVGGWLTVPPLLSDAGTCTNESTSCPPDRAKAKDAVHFLYALWKRRRRRGLSFRDASMASNCSLSLRQPTTPRQGS